MALLEGSTPKKSYTPDGESKNARDPVILLSLPAARNFMLPGGILNSANGAKIPRITRVAILLITRGLLLVFRAIPAPIWALIFLFVFFPGILPRAIALGLYTLGVLGRLMAEVIENLDERPLRALRVQVVSGACLRNS